MRCCFVILVLPLILTVAQAACPTQCKCKTPQMVDCSRRGLTAIPVIPATATTVDLSINNIVAVPDKAFTMAPNLLKIDLRHNSISSISNSAFEGLAYLKYLFLISNRLDDNTDWTSINQLPQLQSLYLSHNSLTKIPPIQSATIFSLVLDSNRITQITFPEEVGFCGHLQSVVLSGNNIEAIASDDLKTLSQVNIKNLDLKNNALVQIDPAAFKPIGVSLETLNLDHNRLDASMIKNALTGLASAHTVGLLTLSLGYNPIQALDKDMLSPLSMGNLRNLQLDGMSFKTVDPSSLAPVQKNLQLVSFKEGGFSKSPLDFTTLPALQDLRIDGNQFKEIPPMPKTLQRLSAARNSIDGWAPSTFNSLISFRGLDLSGNAVRNISNKPGFPNSLSSQLATLQFLSLNNNPFNCSCSLVWFARWAATKPKVVLNFNKYTCATPPDETGKFVKDLTGKPCSTPRLGASPQDAGRTIVVVRGLGGVELMGIIAMLLIFFTFILLLRTVTVKRRVEDRQPSDKKYLLA